MKTTVRKEVSMFEAAVEACTCGLIPAEPYYKATVRDGGHSATAESNDKEAAVASALEKFRESKRD